MKKEKKQEQEQKKKKKLNCESGEVEVGQKETDLEGTRLGGK